MDTLMIESETSDKSVGVIHKPCLDSFFGHFNPTSHLSIISLNLDRWPTRTFWPFFGYPPYLHSKFHRRRELGVKALTVSRSTEACSLRVWVPKCPWQFNSLLASICFNSSVFANLWRGLLFLLSDSCCFLLFLLFCMIVFNSFAIASVPSLFSAFFPV